jgi:fibronectin-binding autotransporter adhesin
MKTKPFRPSRTSFQSLCLWPAVACALLTALTCAATNRTWTGSGSDNNWMTAGNWQGGVAPSPGDSLIFPGAMNGGNETNHNNYPNGTLFSSITIDTARGQDYAIGGNRVVLTNQYLLTEGSSGFGAGGAFVFFDITMTNPNDVVSYPFTVTATGGLTLNNTFDTGGLDLAISNSGSVVINGTLGPTDNTVGVFKYNTGTLTISSSAALSGVDFSVDVFGGTVVMDAADTAYFGLQGGSSLIVDGAIGGLGFAGPGVSISGIGNLGDVDEIVLSGGGGTVTPGDNGAPGIMQCDSFFPPVLPAGPCALQIIIKGAQPGTGYGQLLVDNNYSLGSAVTNQIELAPEWNYTPQLGDSFQLVTQASLEPYSIATNYFFVGLPPNSILDVTNGASLSVSYNANGVTLATLRTATSPFVLWKGSVTGTNYGSRDWSVTNNWAQNAGPASGDVLVFSPYQTSLYTNDSPPIAMPVPPQVTNDLASGTSLAGLVFTGSNYVLYGNPIAVTGSITNNTTGGTNFFDLNVAVAGVLPLDVEPGGTFLMGAVIEGSGTVSKVGGGLLIYDGDTADAFIGTVAVNNGTLEVDGSFTDGSFIVNGGTLDGNGIVSAVTVNSGGTLKPGDSPGLLHVEGNLTMAPGAVFTAELDGPNPGSGYDQLQVFGSVNLNGATLNLQPNFAASAGTAFLILLNNGGAITGTFAGLPEGAVFQAGGQYFTISYQAGFGNKNVVVTRVNPPGNLTRIRSVPPTAVELFGTGGTNATYTILANTNLTTTNWIDIGTAPANGAGSFFFYDSNTLVYPQRFYKLQPP